MKLAAKSWITLAMLGASAAYSVVSAISAMKHGDPAPASALAWLLAFSVLVCLWAREDRRAGAAANDHSWLLMFFFWPVTLAWHLARTRALEGFVLYMGFLAIYLAPIYVRWLTWTCCSGPWTTLQ